MEPAPVPQELSFLERARDALAEANTIEDVRQIHDQAEAARAYARSAAMGLEIQNQITVIKIGAERKMGEFLKGLSLRGGNRQAKAKRRAQNLADFGISQQQSYRWQAESCVPQEIFDDYVSRCIETKQEVTSAAVLRIARTLQRETDARSPRKWLEGMADVCEGLSRAIQQGTKYGCIYVNPAWPQEIDVRAKAQPAAREFAAQLKSLPVKEVAATCSHLHMQASCYCLRDALSVLQKWGFVYKSALMLPRRRSSFAFTQYWQVSCDLLLLGVRGNLGFRDTGLTGWMNSKDGSSEREVMEQLVRVSPGPCLEIFAGSRRSGWDTIPAAS